MHLPRFVLLVIFILVLTTALASSAWVEVFYLIGSANYGSATLSMVSERLLAGTRLLHYLGYSDSDMPKDRGSTTIVNSESSTAASVLSKFINVFRWSRPSTSSPDSEYTTQSSSSTTKKDVVAYFPVPGLQIIYDDKTGNYTFVNHDEPPQSSLAHFNLTDAESAEYHTSWAPHVTKFSPANNTNSSSEEIASDFSHIEKRGIWSPLKLQVFNYSSLVPGAPDLLSNLTASRMRRTTPEDIIPRYFGFIKDLDSQQCLSRMVCEIGSTPSMYGRYGVNLNDFFLDLNRTRLNNPNVNHYEESYKSGKLYGLQTCENSYRNCTQNMTQLVSSLHYY